MVERLEVVRPEALAASPRSRWIPAATAALPVVLLAAVVYAWRVGRPGDWRDETATMSAASRPLGDLLDLTRHLDLVHLGHYLLARLAWQVDPSVTAIRVISVVALSLAAGALVLLGRRLGLGRAGVLAGLLLVVNPWASRYAQEARPFATVALLTVVLTGLLVVLLDRPRRPWAVGAAYGGTLVLLGVANVLALMIVPVHLVWLLLDGRLPGPRGDRLFRWSAAALPALLLLAPFVLLAVTQRGQVSWIEPVHLYDVRALATLETGSRTAPLVVAAAVVVAALIRRWTGAGWLPAGPARSAVLLGGLWASLPPALLFGVSLLVLPLWDAHYLFFTLPGLCLMLAGLLDVGPLRPAGGRVMRGWVAGPAAVLAVLVPVALLATLGLADQHRYRGPAGHGEDLAGVAAVIGDRSRPGDALAIVPADLRVLAQAHPQDLIGVQEVTLVRGPVESGTLSGLPVEPVVMLAALLPHERIWLVRGRYHYPDTLLTGPERETLDQLDRFYRPAFTRAVTDVDVTLMVRR